MTPIINYYQPNSDLLVGEQIYKTSIKNLFYIHNQIHTDERGFFTQLAIIPEVERVIGSKFNVAQMNQSRSEKNVVRGFHAEGWNKLVTVTSGVALCVLVDVRVDSPTFLNKEYMLLGKENRDTLNGSLYLPSGIGNSICVIAPTVNYVYAVDKLYEERNKADDVAVNLFDPIIDAKWPYPKEEMILSQRDLEGKNLSEIYPDKFTV